MIHQVQINIVALVQLNTTLMFSHLPNGDFVLIAKWLMGGTWVERWVSTLCLGSRSTQWPLFNIMSWGKYYAHHESLWTIRWTTCHFFFGKDCQMRWLWDESTQWPPSHVISWGLIMHIIKKLCKKRSWIIFMTSFERLNEVATS